MKIKLSKAIAEIDKDKVQHAWQSPEIFDDVLNDNIWLIYGRKGSGKSTLVDYLEKIGQKGKVLVVRPSSMNLFNRILTSIPITENDDRLIEESIVSIFEFILFSHMIREVVPLSGIIMPGSNHEKIYNFMVKNNLHDGSILRKTINIISKATKGADGKLNIINNLSSALDDITNEVCFTDAKEAFINYVKEQKIDLILCIDDIDEIGFSFSRSDRLFVDALLIFMVRSNVNFINNDTSIRVILTSPSELFFHSALWGSDWVSTKSRCLNWESKDQLHKLVNRRIAIELNIRKSKPKYANDIYSTETTHTWNKLFPSTIHNKCSTQEPAFDYVLRHTFYTPRHLLAICDSILTHLSEEVIDFSPGTDISNYDWSLIFQKTVEDFTYRAENDFRILFCKIYGNLEETINAFQGRPNIWNRQQLLSFVDDECLILTRTDNKREYVGLELILTLQKIGFFGLGTRSILSPTGSQSYDIKYSFLESFPSRKPWELAAVAPLFYDAHDIRPISKVVVKPHEKLSLGMSDVHKISTYNPKLNNFTFND